MSWRIKLHRKIQDNPISSSLEIMWLLSSFLLKANHKEKSFYIWLEKITIWPWQFVSSMSKLADEYEVSKTKIYRMVERLKMERILKHEWNNKYSLFTIINRNKYQWDETQNETPLERQWYTNNNDKEWKEYKLIYNIQDFVDQRNSIKELRQNWKTVRGLPKTIKITDRLQKARYKVTKEYTEEEIKNATNKYIEKIENTIPNEKRDWTHRYSLFEFITRDKWLQNYVNS